MNLKVVEPLKLLFKDEVRRVGKAMDMPDNILAKTSLSRDRDWESGYWEILPVKRLGYCRKQMIFILKDLKSMDLYNKVWQAGVILLTGSIGRSDGR